MGATDFTFSLVDSKGVSHSIIAEHFRLHDFFMQPSRLDLLTNYDPSSWGAGDYAGKVIGIDGNGAIQFIGYVEGIEDPIAPTPKNPRHLICYSLHNLLRYRLLTHRFYSQTWSYMQALSNAMGSIGILNDANHSFPMAIWYLEPSPPTQPNTYMCYIAREELPSPIIYLGSTPLTEGTNENTLLPNQFYQGDTQIWICTPGLPPDSYPAHVSSPSIPFRDTHIRLAPANWWGYNDDGECIPYTCCPNVMETAYEFLNRVLVSGRQEMRFFPQADFTTYLCFRRMVGWNSTPYRTFTDEHVISLDEITLADQGYKQITYHTADGSKTYWQPEEGFGGYDGYFWKEKRISGFRMTPEELNASARYQYYRSSGAKAYRVGVVYDGAIGMGDRISVQKGSISFSWRTLQRIIDSKDKGKMTLILHSWGWS